MIGSKQALVPCCSVVCVCWKFDKTSVMVLNDSFCFVARDSSLSPCWRVIFSSLSVIALTICLGSFQSQVSHVLSFFKKYYHKNTHRAPLFFLSLWSRFEFLEYGMLIACKNNISCNVIFLFIVQNTGKGFFPLLISYCKNKNDPYLRRIKCTK